jgi:aminopeptidase N
VQEDYADGALTLSIAQSCPPTPGQEQKAPFHMPILLGLLDSSGAEIAVSADQISGNVKVELRDDNCTMLG